MKALIKKEATRGVWLEDAPMPTCGEQELLIKVEKTSICGTDIHLYEWDEWARGRLKVPTIIGHEFAGTIIETGSKVTSFKVGDRVSAEGHLTCGICRLCRSGQRVLCPKTIGIGYDCNGAFAEYFAFPAENAFLIPKQISFETASLFDPFGNAVHTALSFDLVGKDVLITGAGPIGLMAIPIARMAGARNVVITDLNPYRLELAKKMGNARPVNVKDESLADVQKELGIEEGFDVCLEMSGSPQAFASLPDHMTNGGKIALLGILPSKATINWHSVIFNMLTIKGIYGREIFRTWYQGAQLLQNGLDLSPVITHRLHYTDFQAGFDAMLSGQSGKVILDWSK